MTFIRALQPGLAAPSASSLSRLLWPHRGSLRISGGDRVGQIWHVLSDPASLQGRHRALCCKVGRENSHAPHAKKKIPVKGHGVVQDVAVLEDTARGQSACQEFASSC